MKRSCFLAALWLSVLSSPAGESRVSPPPSPMPVSSAVILGVVEGVTEYLPVSSTGHLILAERALGIGDTEAEKTAADAYAVIIQFGAILAVAGLYRARILSMLAGLAGRDREGLRLAVNLVVAFLPAAVIGLLFNSEIKRHLFGLKPVVAAWFAGGVAILWVERRRAGAVESGSGIESLSPLGAFGIGLFQCLAMWPGVSRSLSTMIGGRVLGLHTRAAVEFSFLLGGVTLTASTAKDALDHGRLIATTFGGVAIAAGLLAALVSALLAVRWLVGYLNRHSLVVFGWYRIALAGVVALLLAAGRIPG